MSKVITHHIRMSQADAHYGGDLVDGARILGLFGDVVTEWLISRDGDEGLFRAYEKVEFLAPVYAGDYLEVSVELTKLGNTSRTFKFTAYKYIAGSRDPKKSSSAKYLKNKILVATAIGTCVVP